MSTYVDDPLLVLIGSPWHRQWCATRMVVCWLVLCFTLAFKKGQAGDKVTWTSAHYHYQAPNNVKVTVKEDIVEAVQLDLMRFLDMNVIPLKGW